MSAFANAAVHLGADPRLQQRRSSCVVGPTRWVAAGRSGSGSRLCLALLSCACWVACAETAPLERSRLDAEKVAAQPAPRICEALVVETAEDLAAAHDCTEIDGSLTLRAPAIERIDEQDLPYLKRITGSVVVVGARRLKKFRLPALAEVGTQSTHSLFEIGFETDNLARIELPELRTVHGDFCVLALAALRALDIGALATVDGYLSLANLPELTELSVRDSVNVGSGAAFEYLCRFPFAALPKLSGDGADPQQQQQIGCCTESSFECWGDICECD